MAQWLVEYWGRNGVATMPVRASSHAAAGRLSGLPAGRIIRVERSWSWPTPTASVARKPSHRVQLLFLVRACAMYSGTGRVGISGLVDEFDALRRIADASPEVQREDLELSDRLKHLRFDDVPVSLVFVGERTGRLGALLRVAIDYLKQSERVRGAASSQIFLALILFAASCLTFIFMPLFLSEPLRGLLSARGIAVELTPATHFMLWMDEVMRAHWREICAGAAATAVACWRARGRLRSIWPFNIAGRLHRIKRSMRLLMVWVPYQMAGLVLEDETALLKRILGRAACDELLPRLDEGASLGDVLNQRWFSPTLVQAGRGLSGASAEDFKRISEVVTGALIEEHRAFVKWFSTLLYLGGAMATMGVVAMVAFGLIFPILGATANV